MTWIIFLFVLWTRVWFAGLYHYWSQYKNPVCTLIWDWPKSIYQLISISPIEKKYTRIDITCSWSQFSFSFWLAIWISGRWVAVDYSDDYYHKNSVILPYPRRYGMSQAVSNLWIRTITNINQSAGLANAINYLPAPPNGWHSISYEIWRQILILPKGFCVRSSWGLAGFWFSWGLVWFWLGSMVCESPED